QPVLPAELVTQVDAGFLAGLQRAVTGGIGTVAHVGQFIFVTTLERELDQVVLARGPIDLAEVKVFLERRHDGFRRLVAELRRQILEREVPPRGHGAGRVVLLGLVGDEEMHPVYDDGPTERYTVLLLLRVRLGSPLDLPGRL